MSATSQSKLKEYVEGQVASGDWGTPSEYVRELIRQDKERRFGRLQEDLLAAARGRKLKLPISGSPQERPNPGLASADAAEMKQFRLTLSEATAAARIANAYGLTCILTFTQ